MEVPKTRTTYQRLSLSLLYITITIANAKTAKKTDLNISKKLTRSINHSFLNINQ